MPSHCTLCIFWTHFHLAILYLRITFERKHNCFHYLLFLINVYMYKQFVTLVYKLFYLSLDTSSKTRSQEIYNKVIISQNLQFEVYTTSKKWKHSQLLYPTLEYYLMACFLNLSCGLIAKNNG